MKKLILTVAFLLIPIAAFPQAPDSAAVSTMKKVMFLEGQWQGKGWISFAAGKQEHFNQTETVRSALGGSIITIEGKGTAEDPDSGKLQAVHGAYAVIFYDVIAQKLKMHAYKDGKFIAADAQIGNDGSFIWGFDLPSGTGRIRYTIRLNDKGQWYEIGEFSRDGGGTWLQNFEMTLDKV